MGGRPTFVGFIALAVAILGVGTFAAPRSAVAEIRVPLPGSEKKQVKRKRFVRPSRPSRNPTRVTANISAAANSPEAAGNSEAVAVAGTSASARVALALPTGTNSTSRTEPDVADTEDEVAAEEPKTEDSAKGETVQDDTGDRSVSDAEEVDAADTETADNDNAPSAGDEASESAAVETAETARETEESSKDEGRDSVPIAQGSDEVEGQPDDVADAGEDGPEQQTAEASNDPGETDETTGEVKGATDTADKDAAETEPVETEPAETETVDAEIKEAEPAPRTETATVEIPIEAAEAAAPPSIADPELAPAGDGSSVVLPVSPPPASIAGTNDENKSDDETKVASLTPPSVPAAGDAAALSAVDETETDQPDTSKDEADGDGGEDTAAENDAAEDADAETAAADAAESASPRKDETEAGEDTAAAESDATEDSDLGTATAADQPDDAENSDVVIAVSEPPPPPAHPVIARVREKLEQPEAFKGVAASDLAALKQLYGAHEDKPLWVADTGFSQKAKAIMAEIEKADDWGLDASSFDLPDAAAIPAAEDAQADAEIALSIAILSYVRDAQIGRLSPSKVSKLFDQHPTLRDPKAVLTELAGSDTPETSLLSLHPQHTQFKRLQQVLVRARDSARVTGRDPERDRNVQLITMNMERWRWLPRKLGNYYVWNNVPEYEVQVVKGGQSIYREKTIVGQYKYATPFFSAPMRNIVVHPNWTVPPTIVKEDIAPKLKGPGGGGFFAQSKKNILRRYGLAVSYKGEPIDADTVDWNTVNVHKYTFTQDAGPANVLGQFKFNFPNKHAIYMHDTVQRELFSQRQRTLSHGCIRVNQPDRFAALLLGEDKGWSLNQVRSLVARNETKVVSFKRNVPVHLTYFTATVDENGTVRDFADIYGIDNRMARMLFKTPEYFPVPAPPPEVATSQNTRPYQGSRRRSSNNGLDNFLTGLFGN